MEKIKLRKTVPPAILLFSVMILLLLLELIPIGKHDSIAETFIAAIVLQAIAFGVPAFFYLRGKNKKYVSSLNFSNFSLKNIPIILALLSVMIFGSLLINAISYSTGISDSAFTSTASYILSDVNTKTNFLYVVIAVGAVPAFLEELIFRGILYKEYSSYGTATMLVMTSLTYSMTHFDLPSILMFFFSGIVLSYSVMITDSIWSAIAIHFFANILNVYLIPALWNWVTQPLGLVFAVLIVVSIFCVFLVFALKVSEKHYYYLAMTEEEEKEKPKKKKIKFPIAKLILSPEFAICIFVYVLASVIILIV